jgi:hypothetical protein
MKVCVKTKRGIAGTLSFQNFNKDAMAKVIEENTTWLYTDYTTNVTEVRAGYTGGPTNGWTLWSAGNTLGSAMGVSTQAPYYADQIPPFDVTLTYVNEYGNMAVEVIFGVEILNEGKGVHIDDMAVETAMTFIARGIGKLHETVDSPRSGEGTINFPGVGTT